MATPTVDFSHLSLEERLQLVEDLWDSIATTTPESVPVPEWHQRLLDERLAEFRRDGDPGRPWQEVMDEIEAEIDDPRS